MECAGSPPCLTPAAIPIKGKGHAFLVFELFICRDSLYSVEHSPDIETAVAYFINVLYSDLQTGCACAFVGGAFDDVN